VARPGERRVGLVAEALAHEVCDRLAAQRPRVEQRRERIRTELSEERGIGAGLGRTEARDDEHRHPLEPPREVREKTKGRLVAPMQVVDRQERRTVGDRVDGQPEEAVQDGEGRICRAGARLAKSVEHRGRRRRHALEEL
jgi:hypothetical protein